MVVHSRSVGWLVGWLWGRLKTYLLLTPRPLPAYPPTYQPPPLLQKAISDLHPHNCFYPLVNNRFILIIIIMIVDDISSWSHIFSQPYPIQERDQRGCVDVHGNTDRRWHEVSQKHFDNDDNDDEHDDETAMIKPL